MKTKIVIASTLKPVDDVRAYWKFAQSMVQTNKGKYAVIIIGNEGKIVPTDEDITLSPYRVQRSQFLKRLLAPLAFFKNLLKINPHLLIITTHELLFPAVLYKLICKCSLLYDVQENYISNASINRSPIRFVAFIYIKVKEHVLSKLIDHFILAEACYEEELNFTRGRSTVIENKAIAHSVPKRSKDLHLLFSGTISEYSGAMRAMRLAVDLVTDDPAAKALFVGQIHDQELWEKLKSLQKETERISLNLSFQPVSYHEILDAMDWASLGIISYLPNKVNRNKTPTKLYEYSRYQLPYLVHRGTTWESRGKALGGAIPIDFASPDIPALKKDTKNEVNLFPASYPKEATWEYESKKLIALINTFVF